MVVGYTRPSVTKTRPGDRMVSIQSQPISIKDTLRSAGIETKQTVKVVPTMRATQKTTTEVRKAVTTPSGYYQQANTQAELNQAMQNAMRSMRGQQVQPVMSPPQQKVVKVDTQKIVKDTPTEVKPKVQKEVVEKNWFQSVKSKIYGGEDNKKDDKKFLWFKL